MASDWRAAKLGQLCSKIGSGATPRGGKDVYLALGPFALIRSQNIINEGFNASGLAYIDQHQAAGLANVSVEPGDVLLNITGDSVARSCLAPEDYLPARVNQHVAIIRPNPRFLNSFFLRYLMVSPKQQDLMLGLASAGATRNALTKSIIENFDVVLPPVEIQAAIGELLMAFEKRIGALQRDNAILESLARAIFKSWFVDFDPVRAKAEEREPEGVDAAIAALFPDEMVSSELGEIPRGWHLKYIADCVEIVGGSTPSTANAAYWENGEYHWATPKDLSSLNCPVLLNTERKITDEGLASISSGLLPVGTVLLSSRAPIGYLALARVPTAINQGFIAMKPCGTLSNVFLLLWTSSAMDTIKSLANGSTFQEISKRNFRTIQLATPNDSVLRAFDDIAKPLFERITKNAEEMRTLSELRDTLLPRLISGKLRVPEAEKLVEALV